MLHIAHISFSYSYFDLDFDSCIFLSYLGGQSAGVSSGHDDGSSVVSIEESVTKPKKRPRSSSDDDKSSENFAKKSREFKSQLNLSFA